jgi:metallo-beta-lactamase family protein
MEITILGAAQCVTGSCFLLHIGKYNILFECGLVQGAKDAESVNYRDFDFEPGQIDAVVLTHAHLDHSGLIPKLCKDGFNGPIYTHHASKELATILLADSGYLAQKDTDTLNRKRARKHLPLLQPIYTMEQAKACCEQFVGIDYDVMIELFQGIHIRLNDAGHILGSAIVEVFLSEKGVKRKVVFSGDLGHSGAPLLKNPQAIANADWLFMESTYGDRLHRSWDDTWLELEQALAQAASDKGNILIPAFTIGRIQQLLSIFYSNYDDWALGRWHFFLDSPMAIDATKVYAKYWKEFDKNGREIVKKGGSPFALKNLHLSNSSEDSMKLNQINSGAVIIAGSGMCSGGRILHHLKHNIWSKNCHLIITGFQAAGTLGRRLIDGAKEITLWGETINVAAKIHTIGGLSAHADKRGLIHWLKQFKEIKNIVLVHGELKAMKSLAKDIESTVKIKPLLPKKGDTYKLI